MLKKYLVKIIEYHWYNKNNFILSLFLIPFFLLYSLIVFIKLKLYKFNLLKKKKLPVPVVVVGNLTAGGTGKTPITKYLVDELSKHGINAGVIMRGYGAHNKNILVVNEKHNSLDVGDEAIIYRNNGIKVAVGKNRYITGKYLIKEYPSIQIIIADDGLQHYKLYRDYEIIVLDKDRFLGNGCLIPLGPLRESASRLKNVNAVINHKHKLVNSSYFNDKLLYCDQKIVLNKIFSHYLNKEFTIQELSHTNLNLAALCAIGNPSKFFSFVQQLGIKINTTYTFIDHYQFKKQDIPTGFDFILVTEKDYVKLSSLNLKSILVLYIDCKFDDTYLIDQIINLVNKERNKLC